MLMLTCQTSYCNYINNITKYYVNISIIIIVALRYQLVRAYICKKTGVSTPQPQPVPRLEPADDQFTVQV